MPETAVSASPQSLQSLLTKFAQLKSKRSESVKLNKAGVAQETRKQKLTSIQAKSQHRHETDPRKSLSENERAMEYTIEECEAWEQRRQRRLNTGIKDQDKLAEASYYKEIKDLKVDKDAYSKLGKEDTDVGTTDKKVKEEVSTKIKESKDRKFNKKRGRTDDEAGNYISEKNRQFNMKLNRQYN
ncbi:hypothetical protein CANMA_000748 [Candida margitis]|uniref:uncharacterized protein n=1 Tax=Candida margitis TaxID=1775924 RepID=UPI002226206C|nr:uncharacterized protein CANMA_000748 [Candida margitis]KAI5970137.1 hypothetical protein CANMA_000748 [Candida margitis]